METQKNTSLLPLSVTIDHLGRSLFLKKKLGEGFTSEVYEGELVVDEQPIRVAVKARKALDYIGARENFLQEGKTLAQLMESERNANRRDGIPDLKIAPVYYGLTTYKAAEQEVDYIVMEFIDGVEIPKLLNKQHIMPEKDALRAGWQLFRILQLLHTDIRKVFIDLKMENLWWVGGAEDAPGQLKVTDLGTLADIKRPAQVEHDLLLGGIILSTLLTGYTPRYNVYGLKERIDPIIRSHPMTWGTRQLLRRLMHHNPKQRFDSAEDVFYELKTLADYWADSDTELHNTAMAYQEEASKGQDLSNPQTRENIRQARSAFEILSKRSPEYEPTDVQSALKNVTEMWDQTDYLGVGKNLLMGSSWQAAGEMFEKGKEWSDDPTLLRRWGYLAKALLGNKAPDNQLPELREKAIQAVEWLHNEDWEAARQRFQALAPVLNTTGVEALLADCDLAENIKQGEKAQKFDDYKTAAANYQAALEALEKLPDKEFIQKNELGDLRALQVEMEHACATRGEAVRLIKQAVEEAETGQFQNAAAILEQANDADPENPTLVESLLQAARASLKVQQIGQSEAILAIALKRSEVTPEWAAAWQAVNSLRNAEKALAEKRYPAFGSEIRNAYAVHANIPHVLTIAQNMLTSVEQLATETKDLTLLNQLADLIQDVSGPGNERAEVIRKKAQGFKAEQDAKVRDAIDQLIAFTINLLNPEAPGSLANVSRVNSMERIQRFLAVEGSRLNEALRLVQDAEQMSAYNSYRVDHIAGLRTRIEAEIRHAEQAGSASLEALEAEYQKQRAELVADWKQIGAYETWMKQGYALKTSESIQKAAADQLRSQAQQILPRARRLLIHYHPDDLEVQNILNQASELLSKLGVEGWQAIAEQAQNEIAKIKQALTNARTLFEKGQLEKAAAELTQQEGQYGYDPEFRSLKLKLMQVYGFRKWQEKYKATLESKKPDITLLKDLTKFAEQQIPEIYWKNSLANEYLVYVDQWTRQEAARVIKSQEGDFTMYLVDWLILQRTKQKFGMK